MGKIISMQIMEPLGKYEVENPHDKLFKDLLDDEEELKEFVTQFVGINIQLEEIEKCNSSYITNQYEMYQADMVYKIKEKDVYILIEHQSTVDENMPYRMFNYYGETLKETKNEITENIYPLIIPIVLYTGERNWKVETEYSRRINEYRASKKYIKLEYELVDINKYTEEELLNKNSLLSYAMLIEKNRGKESLLKILEKISKRCYTNKNREKMLRIINYILSPILGEDKEIVMEKFKMKEGINMKTAQDYIREEMQEIERRGIEKGRREAIEEFAKQKSMKTAQDYIREEMQEIKDKAKKKGIKEGITSVILNMIENNMKIEEIKKYTGVSEKEIEKIASNM